MIGKQKFKDKFNPKNYQEKDRVYRPVPGCVNIQRLWIWNKDEREYQSPERGKIYEVRRYELKPDGTKRRVTKYCQILDEGRSWQNGTDEGEPPSRLKPLVPMSLPPPASAPIPAATIEPTPTPVASATEVTSAKDPGPTFGAIYEAFLHRKVASLSKGTQINYARYVRLHFQKVLPVPIRDITPQFIDAWLDALRVGIRKSHKGKSRTSFDHELSVMRCVLRFYEEYHDDREFRFPLKSRHAEDAFVKKAAPKAKDLPEDEFLLFREQLAKQKHGTILAPMASVQYYQALRISEAAGLFYEDVKLNLRSPEESSIRVCRHVVYPRVGKARPEISEGFKNAAGGDKSVKELYLYPQAYEALKQAYKPEFKGLIFKPDAFGPFTYRQIQKAYDTAFILADLPYRGTHVLRHGGCRRVYNATGGDLALAQQLLGNSDLESTLVYAQRDKGALKKHVKATWGEVKAAI